MTDSNEKSRKAARRSALLLGVLAVGVYVAFIIVTGMKD